MEIDFDAIGHQINQNRLKCCYYQVKKEVFTFLRPPPQKKQNITNDNRKVTGLHSIHQIEDETFTMFTYLVFYPFAYLTSWEKVKQCGVTCQRCRPTGKVISLTHWCTSLFSHLQKVRVFLIVSQSGYRSEPLDLEANPRNCQTELIRYSLLRTSNPVVDNV